MVGSSSLQSRGLLSAGVPGASAAAPPHPALLLPFTFDFFFPAWLRSWLLPYFGLFRLLCFFAVTLLARNPPGRKKDICFTLNLDLNPPT